jgi:hypothetical protein
MDSTRRFLLRRALVACLVFAAGWLGWEIYMAAPLVKGWQVWSISSIVLLVATIALSAWREGEDPEATDL